MIKAGNIVIGGVGVLNPLQDMNRLSKIIDSRINLSILISYHPPYKCGDLIPALGIRKGLQELIEVVMKLKPALLIAGGTSAEVCNIGNVKVITLGGELNSVKISLHDSVIIEKSFFRLP